MIYIANLCYKSDGVSGMLAEVLSSAVHGIDAYVVKIEVDISAGLPAFNIVGLPDATVRESRDRVMAAIKNSELKFPTKRITVNMAPADIRKEGASFDLPIALGILGAMGRVSSDALKKYVFLGELALNGSVRQVPGVLPIAIALNKEQVEGMVIPFANRHEAAIADKLTILPLTSLRQAVDFLSNEGEIQAYTLDLKDIFSRHAHYQDDFCEVKGQVFAKRALEVAAAGGHNILMIGPPGSGKTMLSRRLPSILPDMTLEESIETTKIHSVAGVLASGMLLATRPFRSPHHTISDVALIGGGTYPKPGEVSLAHNGVLFLDELPEFHRNVLEVMRQPLEDGSVTIARSQSSLTFPAKFMLVAAMNPCPCGFHGDMKQECTCSVFKIQKYMSKVSGPLMDRIDLHIEVPRLQFEEMTTVTPSEASSVIRERVNQARLVQKERFTGEKNIHCNAHMQHKLLKKYCALTQSGESLLKNALQKLNLSARAYDRILKVARTIGDLDGSEHIQPHHLAEALQYRSLDKNLFG